MVSARFSTGSLTSLECFKVSPLHRHALFYNTRRRSCSRSNGRRCCVVCRGSPLREKENPAYFHITNDVDVVKNSAGPTGNSHKRPIVKPIPQVRYAHVCVHVRYLFPLFLHHRLPHISCSPLWVCNMHLPNVTRLMLFPQLRGVTFHSFRSCFFSKSHLNSLNESGRCLEVSTIALYRYPPECILVGRCRDIHAPARLTTMSIAIAPW